jgi:predicted dehydrogenase
MSDSPLPDFKNRNLKVGIIGCGSIARFHADCIKHLGISIAAASDVVSSDSVKAFCAKYSIPAFHADWKEMLDDEALDAVWVTASWDVVDTMLLPILEYDIPVFFEKPVSLSSKTLSNALAIHREKTNKIQVGYNRRFYDFIPQIRDMLSTFSINGIELHIPESISGITPKHQQFLFLQNSSHVVDLLYFLLNGPSISVERIIRNTHKESNSPMGYNAFLLADQKTPIHLIANWNSPSNFGIRFHGDGLLVELLPIETAAIYQGFDIIEPTQENPIRRYRPKIIQQFYMDKISAQFKPGFLKQAVNFIQCCVLGDHKNSRASTLESTLEVTKLCEQIMKEGQDPV